MESVVDLCLLALGMAAFLFFVVRTTSAISRLEKQQEVGLDATVKKRVIVHTSDDQSISGVLLRADPDHFVVGHAHLLTEASPEGVPMAGDVIVLRARVSFMQVTG